MAQMGQISATGQTPTSATRIVMSAMGLRNGHFGESGQCPLCSQERTLAIGRPRARLERRLTLTTLHGFHDADYRFPGPRLRGEHSEATLAQCAELA
jgi:hypothetical protein